MAQIDGGLRKLFRQHLPKAHWTSIETGGTGQGVPDSNGCLGGVETWVEFKRTEAMAVRVDPEQVGWAEQHLRAGGRVFLGVRRKAAQGPRRGPAVDSLYLYHGSYTRAVAQWGLSVPPLACWHGGPARWNWDHVSRIIFSHL